MKAYLKNYEHNKIEEIDTQFLTLREWIKINFCGWGFYKVVYNGRKYIIYNKFENGEIYCECSKIKKEIL